MGTGTRRRLARAPALRRCAMSYKLHAARRPTAHKDADRSEKQIVSACRKLAAQMGCYMEVVSQRGGKGSGTTTGAPDAFLYCSGRCVPVEFKRSDGRLSVEQATCLARRLDQHVLTHIIRSEDEFIALINCLRRGGDAT